MKFSYTALGSNNQKLTGVLEAESLDLARAELHKMGLSVIALSEATGDEQVGQKVEAVAPPATSAAEGAPAPAQAAAIVTYYFQGKDTQNKEVNGTIDAQNPYSAYKRLNTEYQFQVVNLYEHGTADPELNTYKKQFSEWNKKLKEEGIDLEKVRQQATVKSELADEGEKMAEEIVTEIDNFIINTKAILAEHKDQYSQAFLQEIETTLDRLERIRSSNNLKHITKVCNNLYELIAHPDQITDETAGQPKGKEYKSIVEKLKGSGFVKNKFQFLEAHKLGKKASKFGKVQGIFSKITSKLGGKADGEAAPKKRSMKWLSKLTAGMGADEKAGDETLLSYRDVVAAFFAYIKETNAILRRAKKQELSSTYQQYKKQRKDAKAAKKLRAQTHTQEGVGRDFSEFYMEVDSFLGWLLFFYLTYFFLVSFSLERNIGLSQELVVKTLSSPLIINISIFLVIAHLAFKLKVRLFRRNFLGSTFLLFFSLGIYAIIIANF